MGKKGLSLEEKRQRILGIYYEKKEVFNLKEIEKLGAKRGVVFQSIGTTSIESLIVQNFAGVRLSFNASQFGATGISTALVIDAPRRAFDGTNPVDIITINNVVTASTKPAQILDCSRPLRLNPIANHAPLCRAPRP